MSEVTDHIRSLNEIFLHLEKNAHDKAALLEAFRIFHSIKGDSAAMGLREIVEIAHEAEDLLAAMKDGKRLVDQSAIERLFNYIDKIEALVKDLANGNSNNSGVALQNETSTERTTDSIPTKGNFKVTINNNFEEQLKQIRAFALLRILADNGNLLSIDPPYEQLASGKFATKIVSIIATQDIEKLKNELMKIPGIVSLDIEVLEANPPEENGVGAIAALDKLCQIDNLISNFEVKSQESNSASLDLIKDRHRLGEIKVRVQSLDKLFNLVGELVLAKSRLNNIVKSFESPDLKEIQRFIEGVVTDLQNEVMNIRLMPIGQVFGIFSRMVRDLAKASGKEIDLVIEGGDTAVDRKVLEEIMDPVIHIIRNAVDHGIEPPKERLEKGKNTVGTIKIRAYRETSNFVLDIEDDGRGLDPKLIKETALSKGLINTKKAESISDEEALYLICIPGFSTKKSPSKTSGRGMGMSAVKSKVESMGGILTIKSSNGMGTKVSMRLPASMATVKILVVRVGGQCYAIPLSDVVEIVQVKGGLIKYIQGEPFIELRGKIIRVHALSKLLGINDDSELRTAVIVRRIDGREYGLLVSEVVDEDEVAMKPVPNIFQGMRSLLGTSVLGDGRPTFIIDVMTLV
ncbi:MAG: chemotaxis protein CheA [Candidatus Methanomethyliaceae archaeon]|nr:chemotaxis protein CheA [Candidatus Methanomethyliaceae archaeon]